MRRGEALTFAKSKSLDLVLGILTARMGGFIVQMYANAAILCDDLCIYAILAVKPPKGEEVAVCVLQDFKKKVQDEKKKVKEEPKKKAKPMKQIRVGVSTSCQDHAAPSELTIQLLTHTLCNHLHLMS